MGNGGKGISSKGQFCSPEKMNSLLYSFLPRLSRRGRLEDQEGVWQPILTT